MRFTDNKGPFTVGECVALGVMIMWRDRTWNTENTERAVMHANSCLGIPGDDGYTRRYLDNVITDGGLWKGTL